MLARTQLLRVQKDLYLRLKDCAKLFFGGLTPEMRRYYRDYQREFSTYSSLSYHTELVTTVEAAQIAVCGDYHTLSQAQRTVIRLTREVLPTLRDQKRSLVIALELASPAHDVLLRSFLKGKISEKHLLKGLDFENRWGFPWENYRPLFRFAQLHQIPIVGISPPPSRKRPTLEERDRYAARVITDLTAENPALLVVALMGDLHLAASHLPAAIRTECAKRGLTRDTVIIHQNNETLYWELAEMGLESKVDVVKIRDGVFCLFNTPPWVKLQSHLKWAELVSEQTAAASDGGAPSSWTDALTEVDHVEEVSGLVESIAGFLRVKTKDNEKNLSVNGPEDSGRITASLREWQFTEQAVENIGWFLEEFQSVFIPRANYLCLRSPSLNHEARLAAIYLHSRLSGFAGIFEVPRNDFYRFTLVEALGFFGSKVLNPRRKSRGIEDLEKFATRPDLWKQGPPQGRKVAVFCLNHWKKEQEQREFRLPEFDGRSRREQLLLAYKAAKVLGKALGEGLYQAVTDGKVDRSQIADLFQLSFDKLSPQEARDLYCRWGARLDRLGYRLKAVKSEVRHGKKRRMA